MKLLLSILALIVLVIAWGTVTQAQAPTQGVYYLAPNGSMAVISATDTAVAVVVQGPGGKEAVEVSIYNGQAQVSVSSGFGAHRSSLTPTELIVDGVRRF